MPAGRFIVHRDGAIEWLTEYAPLKTHASGLDDEIMVPGREVPEGAHNALLLENGRMPVLFGDRVEVLDRDDEVEMNAPLAGTGPRLPGLKKEVWETSSIFSGHKRGMRLFPSRGRFLVTAERVVMPVISRSSRSAS